MFKDFEANALDVKFGGGKKASVLLFQDLQAEGLFFVIHRNILGTGTSMKIWDGIFEVCLGRHDWPPDRTQSVGNSIRTYVHT